MWKRPPISFFENAQSNWKLDAINKAECKLSKLHLEAICYSSALGFAGKFYLKKKFVGLGKANGN